jgi:hypothetical protein
MNSAGEDSKARRRVEREARLQAALRDNLRRRKVQARQRAESERTGGTTSPPLASPPLASEEETTDGRG